MVRRMLHSSSSRQGKLTSIQFLTFVCIHYRRTLETLTLSRRSSGDGGASRAPALEAAGSSSASQSNESSTLQGSFLFKLQHCRRGGQGEWRYARRQSAGAASMEAALRAPALLCN